MKTDNELIAEFMGLVPTITYAATGDLCGYYLNPRTHQRWEDARKPPPFDLYWDWLMPVVEKIEKIPGTVVGIDFSGCTIQADGIGDIGIDTFGGLSKLECTYKAVVEFIKWYNSQNV